MYQYSMQRPRLASRGDCRRRLRCSTLQCPLTYLLTRSLTHYGLLLWSSDAVISRVCTAPRDADRAHTHTSQAVSCRGYHLPRCTTSVPGASAPWTTRCHRRRRTPQREHMPCRAHRLRCGRAKDSRAQRAAGATCWVVVVKELGCAQASAGIPSAVRRYTPRPTIGGCADRSRFWRLWMIYVLDGAEEGLRARQGAEAGAKS
jgi:hypothetical protein